MSSFIKKNISIICMLFLLSGPIIDFVTGVMLHIFDISLTLGLILRILFLFFIFYVTTFIYNKKNNLLYYGIFGIYLLLFILGLALFKDNPNYFREIQNTFRRNKNESAEDEIFSLQDDIFEERMRESYNELANPSRKLMLGNQALNELFGGGLEETRVYTLLGLPGETA